MTGKSRIRTIILIVILLMAVTGSAWAGARRWTESITAHYRSDLKITVDGRKVTPEVAPYIVDPGYLMAPAEFIARELGARIEWDDETSTLAIYTSQGGRAKSSGWVAVSGDEDASQEHDGQVQVGGTTDSRAADATDASTATSTYVESRSKSLKSVIADVSPSVVLIATYDASGKGVSQGSGVVVAENIIVTNQHVVDGASKVVAMDSHGNLYVCSGTLATNDHRDLALLQCESPLKPVVLGDVEAVELGDDVVAIGCPRGLQGSVSTGIVSGKRKFSGVQYIQTTAPTSPGSSGGGLFAMDSSLIGITTLIYKDSQNLNLVVPVSYVQELLAQPAVLTPYPSTQTPANTEGTKPVARYFSETIVDQGPGAEN
jgi:hypothetical protein